MGQNFEEHELDVRAKELNQQAENIDRDFHSKKLKLKFKKDENAESVVLVKRFGDALWGTIAKMPQDAIDLVPFFCHVEQLFGDITVE